MEERSTIPSLKVPASFPKQDVQDGIVLFQGTSCAEELSSVSVTGTLASPLPAEGRHCSDYFTHLFELELKAQCPPRLSSCVPTADASVVAFIHRGSTP